MTQNNEEQTYAQPITRKPARLLLGILCLFTGVVLCLLAWSGITQLYELGSANPPPPVEDFPLVKWVWEKYLPKDGGPVEIAKHARKVQSTFLMTGMAGIAMVLLGPLLMYLSKRKQA